MKKIQLSKIYLLSAVILSLLLLNLAIAPLFAEEVDDGNDTTQTEDTSEELSEQDTEDQTVEEQTIEESDDELSDEESNTEEVSDEVQEQEAVESSTTTQETVDEDEKNATSTESEKIEDQNLVSQSEEENTEVQIEDDFSEQQASTTPQIGTSTQESTNIENATTSNATSTESGDDESLNTGVNIGDQATGTTTEISNTQDQLSTSTATSTATTTDDEIEMPEDGVDISSSIIKTGKAVALANILNVINSNFVNSDGVVYFSNFFEVVLESIDFRSLFGSKSSSSSCSLSSCQGDHTQVNTLNDGVIDNSLFIEAISGLNHATGTASSTIETGDAYAGLNLVNVLNSNFVDSNYLLVTVNAFDDVQGDVVFPNASHFLSALSDGELDVNVTNDANIENDVRVEADSGGNEVTSSSGAVKSGDAKAHANVFNELNSTLVGGNNMTILFRVHGNWAGEVFGAPDDLLWTQGPDGSVFLFDRSSQGSQAGNGGSTGINSTSSAKISNNVQVAALTGKNLISEADTSLISTGDAYAGANIINIANGNVVGKNWILAIINIFGDFEGDIAFGRPDLWIGEQISANGDVKDGNELTYTLTIINNGDSPATEVKVTDTFNNYLEMVESSHEYSENDNGQLTFNLPALQPGDTTEIVYRARISGAGEGTDIENIVTVLAKETDNNYDDNTDTATIQTINPSRGGGGGTYKRLSERNDQEDKNNTGPVMKIERSRTLFMMTSSGSTIRQTVTIQNTSDTTARNVVFYDVLREPEGEIISREVWDLGDVLAGEHIELGYNVSLNSNAQTPSQKFNLTSILTGDNFKTRVSDNGIIFYLNTLALETSASNLENEEPELVNPQISATSTVRNVQSTSTPEVTYLTANLQDIENSVWWEVILGYIRTVFASVQSLIASILPETVFGYSI